MSDWVENLNNKIKKKAIDKLPSEETASPLDALQPEIPEPAPDAIPTPAKPLTWNNNFLVKTDSTEFIVELTPSIVTDPSVDQSNLQPAQADPMADKSLNPEADPELLKQWLATSDDNDKPYQHNEQGTMDPLSKEEEGIEDTGDEQSVKVHNKKALLKKAFEDEAGQNTVPISQTPGTNRSNAYPPCKYCANYNAAENTCSQGLDVEKVQAAKSCSWLNSTLSPFKSPKDDIDLARQDKDIVKSDVSDMQGNGNEGIQSTMGMTAKLRINSKDKLLKDYLEHIWD
jgi:hypothetical protein